MRSALSVALYLLATVVFCQRLCYRTDSITYAGKNFNEDISISIDSSVTLQKSKLMLYFHNEDTVWTYTIERETALAGNCP